ncbi:MFS transporter [Vibrio caribbeanicus]|uniref:MFS transporter n=1 Tax=Vibrio caribbeanicus TaxID=701175 RepID=UPI0030DA4D08
MNKTVHKYLTILVLSLAGSSIYALPYIKYVFYDVQLAVMDISHMESGMLISVYALGCMLTYIPGGMLTDRISQSKAMGFSLIGTATLGVVYMFTLSYSVALVIWFLFAITTTFVFWTSLIKAISLVGEEDEQARLYGLYYAGNGLAGTVINVLALKISTLTEDPTQGFIYSLATLCCFCLFCGILVLLVIRDTNKVEALDEFNFADVKGLLKMPTLWCFSLIVFSGYAVSSSTAYFTPYLSNVVGISIEDTGLFSIIRSHLFYLIAPLGGYLADRVFQSTAKLFILLFSLLALTLSGVLFLPSSMGELWISVYTLLPGAFGLMLYGLVFSIIRETGIPLKVAGTAIGIASLIGYTPDLFMSTLFGYWLDRFQNNGYWLIFLTLAGISLSGVILSAVVFKKNIGVKEVTAERSDLNIA